MVDELMLQDVKNIFKKIEVIRAREDFLLVLDELGVSRESSDEVINEAIVSRMMSEQELTLYKKYNCFFILFSPLFGVLQATCNNVKNF